MTDADLEAKADAAIARLDAATAAGHELRCPKCGHTDRCEDDPEKVLLRCVECGARIAFGVLVPTVVPATHAQDRRFVALTVDAHVHGAPYHAQFALDRHAALELLHRLADVLAKP